MQYENILMDEDIVAVFLMKHRFLGADSPWDPYLAVLPPHVPLPSSFLDEEVMALHDPIEIHAARERRAELRKAHASLESQLAALMAAPTVAANGKEQTLSPNWRSEASSLDSYLWAMSLVGSRALTLQGKKYLVPFADMFNYSPHPNERRADQGAHFLKYHVLGKDSFTVKADRDVAPSHQVFEDYGDNENSIYLHHHGFVPDVNPFDCAKLDLPLPNLENASEDSHGQQQKTVLMGLGLTPRMATCLRLGKPVPRSLRRWVGVMDMTQRELLSKCKQMVAGSRTHQAVKACVGGRRGRSSFGKAAVLSRLEQQLAAYPTSIVDDEAALQATQRAGSGDNHIMTENLALAMKFRVARKRLLMAIIGTMKPSSSGTPTPEPQAAANSIEQADVSATGAVETSMETSPTTAAGLDDMGERVARFNAWFESQRPPVSYVKAAYIDGR